MGWLTSWATDAANSPMVVTRLMWARSPCAWRKASSARFWSSMSVVVPTNLRTLSFRIAQDHGLLEVPAILPVPRAKRPGFHRETLSRIHALPKASGRSLPVLGVDRGHPSLGMRADEIRGLTGEFKPDLIHEIRCPVGLKRPGRNRKTLQQPDLELEIAIRELAASHTSG